MDLNWNESYVFNVLCVYLCVCVYVCVCVCVCNVCAFASNIHADMIVCLLMYILSLQSIIYLRLKRVSFINVCMCVCCACEPIV